MGDVEEAKAPNPQYDIAAWSSGVDAFTERVRRSKEDEPALAPTKMVRLDRVNPRFAYALFVEFISPKPNGFYTVIQQGAPADNMIWWDFFISTGPHLVDFMNGVNGMEAHVYSAPDGFDPERFVLASTQRYSARINARADSFERHLVFVNHYRSYRESLDWLKGEIEALDVSPPRFLGGYFENESEAEAKISSVKAFRDTALKFHVLAKNLLTTAAFACEALVSTLLRIGSLPPLRQDPETLLFPVLRSGFAQKLRVMHAYHAAVSKAHQPGRTGSQESASVDGHAEQVCPRGNVRACATRGCLLRWSFSALWRRDEGATRLLC